MQLYNFGPRSSEVPFCISGRRIDERRKRKSGQGFPRNRRKVLGNALRLLILCSGPCSLNHNPFHDLNAFQQKDVQGNKGCQDDAESAEVMREECCPFPSRHDQDADQEDTGREVYAEERLHQNGYADKLQNADELQNMAGDLWQVNIPMPGTIIPGYDTLQTP